MKKPLAWLSMVIVGATLTLNYWRPEEARLVASTVAPTEQIASAADTASTPTTTTLREFPTTTSAPAASSPEQTTTTQPPVNTTTVGEDLGGTVVVAGPESPSRFGDFQVEVTITDGVIVDVVLVAEPGDRRSLSINRQAVPVYRDWVLEAQSPDIDVISGATVTWISYTESLQGALDVVGFVS